MGQGLGKNSPVLLTLGRENYEALIERHGQWVRWRVATKCPCVKPSTQQPDIHCTKCAGLGVTYAYQDETTVTTSVMVTDSSGIIEIDEKYTDCPMIRCYDNSGIDYEKATKTDTFVILNASTSPQKGVYVTVVMKDSVLKTVDEAVCNAQGNGYYQVEGLRSSRKNIDGLHHSVPGDIERIGEVSDDFGNVFHVSEIRQDCIYVDDLNVETINEQTGDPEIAIIKPPSVLYAKDIIYLPPYIFVLMSQNLNKSDDKAMQENNGDAILSFPYDCDVANDDVITVLSGTYTQKHAITKRNAEYDVIPAYFVDSVTKCIGQEREYIQDVDFILCGTNYIKWLCADCPEDGEVYTISYRVFPTYKVVKNIPQIRTSENQRMPKKAVVKLYDTYGEMRGVNKR